MVHYEIQFTTKAPGVLVWFFPGADRKDPTKSHETLQTKSVSCSCIFVDSFYLESGICRRGQHPTLSPILYHNESRSVLWQSRVPLITVLATVLLLFTFACSSQSIRRSGMPAAAQTCSTLRLKILTPDATKALPRSCGEWRNDTSLDESKATFQKLHDKLGKVRIAICKM